MEASVEKQCIPHGLEFFSDAGMGDVDSISASPFPPIFSSTGAHRKTLLSNVAAVKNQTESQLSVLRRIQNIIAVGVTALELRMAEADNSMLPVISLPPELLGEILAIAVGAHARSLQWALRYSHVCSYWRGVALDTSSMWDQANAMHFSVLYDQQLFDAWLARTRNRPLRLYVQDMWRLDHHADGPTSRNHELTLVSAPIPKFPELGLPFDRVQSLSIIIDSNIVRDFLTPQNPTMSFPNLEDLDILVTQTRDEPIRVIWTWFAPTLRNFRLVDHRVDMPHTIPFHLLNASLQSLHLECGRSRFVPVAEALQRCNGLTRLTLNGVHIRRSRSSESLDAPVSIENVEELHIGPITLQTAGMPGQSAGLVLEATTRHFVFPNLRVLSLHIDEVEVDSAAIIQKLILESRHLETIRILSTPSLLIELFHLLLNSPGHIHPSIRPPGLTELALCVSPSSNEYALAEEDTEQLPDLFRRLLQRLWNEGQALNHPTVAVQSLYASEGLLHPDRKWYEERVSFLHAVPQLPFRWEYEGKYWWTKLYHP